jgi:2-oxoglutarate dehydrogenase E2 component (dihydrolipoamide succinyltransferase)
MSGLVAYFRSTVWWVAPLVVLALIIGWEVDWGNGIRKRQPADSPPAPKEISVDLLPNFAIEGGLAARKETIDRTLFNPTRRPAPVAVVEAAKPRIERGQFSLTGTTVAGDRSLAFLKETKGGKARTVRKGDTINGMLVADVRPDRVKLAVGEESEELMLRVVTNPKPTPVPPPPAPAAGAAPAAAPAQAAPPAQPQPQPQQRQATPPQNAAQTLAERRRAARAAEAAANAAAANEAEQAAGAAAAAGQPDPRWQQMDERYRRRTQGAQK